MPGLACHPMAKDWPWALRIIPAGADSQVPTETGMGAVFLSTQTPALHLSVLVGPQVGRMVRVPNDKFEGLGGSIWYPQLRPQGLDIVIRLTAAQAPVL